MFNLPHCPLEHENMAYREDYGHSKRIIDDSAIYNSEDIYFSIEKLSN